MTTSQIRFIAIPVLLLLLTSDSIIHAKQQVLSFYNNSKAYVYLASQYGEKEASFDLYQATQDAYWLELSAKQEHATSAYLWSQHVKNQDNTEVWLQRAIQLDHAPAALHKLDTLVMNKQWQQAQDFAVEHKALLSALLYEQKEHQLELHKRLLTLQRLISLSLNKEDNKLTRAQYWQNWINKYEIEKPKIDFEQLPNIKRDKFSQDCKMVIQPLVERPEFSSNLANFKKALNSSYLSELSICVNSPQYLPELTALCQMDENSRANCHIDGLMALPELNKNLDQFSQLLIVTDGGEANVRGGIMFLDQYDSEEVFIHELSHWLGLVDEYPLSSQQQTLQCNTNGIKRLGHNVYIAPKSVSQKRVESVVGKALYQTETCQQHQSVQAYKVLAETSFMQYLDTPLSKAYADLILQNVEWHQVPTATLNFAWAIESNDLRNGALTTNAQRVLQSIMLEQAAAWGNSHALYQLSELWADETVKAASLLKLAATLGNEQAQLELAHKYLEGDRFAKSVDRSAFWYQQAAEQNNDFGLYFFGKCFELGWGCQQSKIQALELYRKSAMLGNKLAKDKLSQIEQAD